LRVSWRAWLASVAGVSALALAGGTVATAKAEASVPARPAVSTSFTVPHGQLSGVASPSPGNAWAVGSTINPSSLVQRPLLLHWNGRRWSQQTVPGVSQGQLTAVTAVSASNVWVVGSDYGASASPGIVILHWNGRAWSRVASPSNASYQAVAVAATSRIAWVAAYNGRFTEFLHLTGGRWYVVPTNLPLFYQVTAFALVGPKLAWAAGVYQASGGNIDGFLLRWNGSVWKRVTDPMWTLATQSMASGAGGVVWAAGDVETIAAGCSTRCPFIWRWNGKSWRPLVIPEMDGFLGVAVVPGGTAWAVGSSLTSSEPVIAHWTGRAWTIASPVVAGSLNAVAATSARDAWAVGNTDTGSLIEHWNGKTWN
jgi:hypothetical protein